MPELNPLTTRNRKNVRKGILLAAYFADPGAALIEFAFDVDGHLLELPVGYYEAGWISTDGLSFGRDVSVEDAYGTQSTEPIRSDKTEDKRTFGATFMETNRVTVALSEDKLIADLPALGTTMAFKTGNEADQPERRALLVYQDGKDDQAHYKVRFFPAIKVTDFGDNSWQRSDPDQLELTFTAYYDEEYQGSSQYWYGGPGYTALGA